MCADTDIYAISVLLVYIASSCVAEIVKELNTVWNKELIKGNMKESSPEKVSPESDLEGLVENC